MEERGKYPAFAHVRVCRVALALDVFTQGHVIFCFGGFVSL